MREIKFRAWWRDTLKPVKDFMSEYCFEAIYDGCFIVEQYTGLKDKNGVEIYEGDIVYIVKDKFGRGKNEVWTVEYMAEGSAAFCAYNQLNSCRVMEEALYQDSLEFSGVGSFSPDGLGLAICEVVGNIHENPELLESQRA